MANSNKEHLLIFVDVDARNVEMKDHLANLEVTPENLLRKHKKYTKTNTNTIMLTISIKVNV